MKKLCIYSDASIENLFKSNINQIKDRIESESEEYILNVGDNQYTEYIKKEFTLNFPKILFDDTYAESYEADIPGSKFPRAFFKTDLDKSYKLNVIMYHIPYEGSIHLLRFRPRRGLLKTGNPIVIEEETNTIRLEVIDFYHDPEKIKDELIRFQEFIFSNYENLKIDVDNYNDGLDNTIHSLFNIRKQQILKNKKLLASLGVPIVQREDTPSTFLVPKPNIRKEIIVKPKVNKKGFQPEPTLDLETYQYILKTINDIGKNFERLPSTYKDKREEDLRDHILMTIDPIIKYGSASGETFNKSGKTDIQLRHDSSVVFVAECKFWSGQKDYFKSIDQLLNYLTWRDSKTSLIIFVTNKEITPVLKTVFNVTEQHQNYLKQVEKSDEGWFNFIFALPTDINKEIMLAVQLFHLPK